MKAVTGQAAARGARGIARGALLRENPSSDGSRQQDIKGRQLVDNAADPLMAAYLERRDDLIRYFRVRLRSLEAAEDVVQDIGLKIARAPSEPIDNPSAYLYRMGANLMLDHLKKERRVGRRASAWRELAVDTEGLAQPRTEEPPADQVIAGRERLRLVIETVNRLPHPVREAFRLHKLEGLSHAETAAAMGVSRSSVEKYIMTSLRHLLKATGE